jgi:hypothetical protein
MATLGMWGMTYLQVGDILINRLSNGQLYEVRVVRLIDQLHIEVVITLVINRKAKKRNKVGDQVTVWHREINYPTLWQKVQCHLVRYGIIW